MEENPAITGLKGQLTNFLLQKHELEWEIKDKGELLKLVDEKIGQLRHAINGAQLAVQAAAPPTPPA